MGEATVYFAKLKKEAVIPSKRGEDAGYDVFPCIEGPFLRIPPMQTVLVPTGIASAFPAGYYFQIQERGSTGSRGIAKRCGVIDSGYRGEWFLPMTNLNPLPLFIAKPSSRPLLEKSAEKKMIMIHYCNKAIAQAIFLRLPEAGICELSYDELLKIDSERGTASLGSTDK